MSCAATMCFNSSATSDDNHRLTDGLRTKLLQISKPKRDNAQRLPQSRLSSLYAVKNPETVAKVGGVMRSTSPEKNTFLRLKPPISTNVDGTHRQDVVMKTQALSSDKVIELDLSAVESKKPVKQDKSVFVATQFVAKMKTKQMKGMLSGMGKEIRRAATTVGDTLSEKIPNPTKKKNKAEKDRRGLLGSEPQKPQIRNADEIKKAYGHSNDARSAAGMAHDKLRERGEKLSTIQRRTAELESDAANFSSLAQELVKKMENRKWYEI